MSAPTARRRESGMALLGVLVILFVVTASSGSFTWFMNQQQTRAGTRLRVAAALAAAEAGVHRALAILETASPDGSGPGRAWRPRAHEEPFAVGPFDASYTVSLADDADGAVIITSVGRVAGVTRRVRARVYLASPALLTALYGTGFVRLEQPPAVTLILPYSAGLGDRPWIHIAAGEELWFATTDVNVNHPAARFAVTPGPLDGAAGASAARRPTPGPVRVLLARDAELTLYRDRERVDVQQLRVMGAYIEGTVLRTETLPVLPEVDRAYYSALAATNTANAAINEAAGRYAGDVNLARKPHSLYTPAEFTKVQTHLGAGSGHAPLRGVVYVRGGVAVVEDQELHIEDGALVTESAVFLGQRASLTVTHSTATRTLPGLIILDNGGLIATGAVRMRIHGLVYASRVISIGEGASVDVIGAVLGADPGLSIRNFASTVVIRYDPAVLGTPGLRVPDSSPAVAWVAAWEELP